MMSRWLSYITFACFGLLTLMAIYSARRPLCIDSKVVERIDRLGVQSTDLVYRCAVNKDVRFNTYFNENARVISQRIGAVERFLESIEPFKRKMQITILEDRPYLFRIQDHQIFIGQALFEADGHLEKALAKVWYRERADSFFINQTLMEEVFTDFLVYGSDGALKIENPLSKKETDFSDFHWPYVIKSAAGYCDSPWKFSEHVSLCAALIAVLKPQEEIQSLKDVVTEYSLRPLLTHAWISSFQTLPFRDQGAFLKGLPRLLRETHSPELPIVLGPAASDISRSDVLSEAASSVKNMNSFISTSQLIHDSAAYKSFLVGLNYHLRASGFNDKFAEATFDLLFVSEQPLSNKSKIYTQLKELALTHPHLHIALRDSENVWMLPASFPIPLSSLSPYHAQKTVVEKCGAFNFSYVLKFADITEKLLVVDVCRGPSANPTIGKVADQELKYSQYLLDGVQGFGQQNQGVTFIQFHLPSLVMKQTQLSSLENLYDLVQKHELTNPVFKSLGWQEVKWNESVKAFQPKAFVDGIEWFRVPGKIKNN